MIIQFLLGSILVVLTVIVHAVILNFLAKLTGLYPNRAQLSYGKYWKVIIVSVTVLIIFASNIIQIWLWAITFYFLNDPAITDFETALYFSTSSFTTAAYGDVVLSPQWRLLGSFEGVNGLMLFGWSAAFIFDVVLKLYKGDDLEGDRD